MRKCFILAIGLLYANQVSSQNEIDALRYSQHNIFSTAKFSSMGGSFGALGADFSCLSYNPAGIGLYQNSELTITPGIYIIETNAASIWSNSNRRTGEIEISNLGLVITKKYGIKKDEEGEITNPKFKRINFAIGYNQLANYNREIYTKAQNNTNSLADILLNSANGDYIENLDMDASLAFWSNIIDLDDNSIYSDTLEDGTINQGYLHDNGEYISHVIGNSNKTQSKSINSWGSKGEYVFSIGTSLQDMTYLGLTIGVPIIEYEEYSTYTENDFDTSINGLNSLNWTEDIIAEGSGVNLKLGMITRLSQNLRIGAAIHTPSYISMHEEFKKTSSTRFDDATSFQDIYEGWIEYDIVTPWKIIASISTNINKRILINAEIEQTDHSFTRMYPNFDNVLYINSETKNDIKAIFAEKNNIINETYTSSTNFRIGGEIRLNPFMIRGGYGHYGSPFKENNEYKTESYSVGLGVDLGKMFLDVSYSRVVSQSEHSMYDGSEIINIDEERNRLLGTIGFRF